MHVKPKRLQPGDRIAAVSLSWGGAGQYPHRYEAGKRQFEDEFGVTVVETEHALRDPEWLHENPQARAEDLMGAFADDSINGIVSTIGGDESIRTLPFVDFAIIRRHPKVFMGYSDTTVSHLVCFKAGVTSFYGPAFLTGLAENGGMFPYMIDSIRRTLFSADPVGVVAPNDRDWTVEHLDWSDPHTQTIKRKLSPCTGWRFHQELGVSEGILFGGCLEVLDWLRGTPVWPTPEELDGAILFLETSEEKPPPHAVSRFLRSLAAIGVLEKLSGILMGRPGGQLDPGQFVDYEKALLQTVREEHRLVDLPIVTNMDFGHTDPIMVLPLGVNARIDSNRREFSIIEPAVSNG